MPPDVLNKPPRFLRSPIARGLMKRSDAGENPPVDPQGGDLKAGIIRSMAVITRGEALGHGLWIDQDFVASVSAAMIAEQGGVKVRFTHPGLSGDGLGKFLGRMKSPSIDAEVSRGDLHFSESAHSTPDGDLAAYVMKLATEDPTSFGASISFEHDFAAEEAFMLANGGRWEEDGYGNQFIVDFKSPDPENVRNYPHARLKELRAVDVVDDPAANPNGLFHRGQELAADAESLFAFSLGLTDKRPDLVQLDLDPDRVGGFVRRFLDRHGLKLVNNQQGTHMPPTKNALNSGTEQTTEETPASGATESAEEAKPGDTPPAKPEGETEKPPEGATTQAGTGAGAKFLAAFGDQGGVWFAQGKTFEQAQSLYTETLKANNAALAKEVADLKGKLAGRRGEATPLSFSPNDEKPGQGQPTARERKLGTNLAKIVTGTQVNRVREHLN